MARDKYKVKLIPVDVPPRQSGKDDGTYNASFAKFLAWDETDYDRILHLDSDVTMLRHLDEVFLVPKAPVAMLRAYWKLPETRALTSLLVLLEPSATEFERLMDEARGQGDYDMEILNRLYGDSALVLPHRQYGLLTGEFRSNEHKNYLGNGHEEWDAEKVISAASLREMIQGADVRKIKSAKVLRHTVRSASLGKLTTTIQDSKKDKTRKHEMFERG
ncbi:N-acetylglucosaminyltransferase [Pseudocyphellaria aurata]|nr:N-acetylglucosaminyltransferase [Pseudocyphellaria aurata]